jgi:hypothetical protein
MILKNMNMEEEIIKMNPNLRLLLDEDDQEHYIRADEEEKWFIIDLDMYPFTREDYGEKIITLEEIKNIENKYGVKFLNVKRDNDDFGEHTYLEFSINEEEDNN